MNENETNFQYLGHVEVEILNSNFKLKDLVFSIGENSAEKSNSYEEKVVEEKKSSEGLRLKELPKHLKYKEAIAWSIEDLKGISPSICMHKILLEENARTFIEHQRRMNLVMKEVVRKEVLKWLNVGFIYAISDNPWVSPVHVVPKKGGFTVIRNEKNELIPTRTVTGWRVCIDYKKLNTTTRKDHYPLPFID